jgi:DNA invertase Pin-like site-specific DNA recombinase
MRAVIYARYSSDNQREASIEDQVRICREQIAAEGWQLVQVYHDAALSGATTLRPGYQALLEGARARRRSRWWCPRRWTACRATRKTWPRCSSGCNTPAPTW